MSVAHRGNYVVTLGWVNLLSYIEHRCLYAKCHLMRHHWIQCSRQVGNHLKCVPCYLLKLTTSWNFFPTWKYFLKEIYRWGYQKYFSFLIINCIKRSRRKALINWVFVIIRIIIFFKYYLKYKFKKTILWFQFLNPYYIFLNNNKNTNSISYSVV